MKYCSELNEIISVLERNNLFKEASVLHDVFIKVSQSTKIDLKRVAQIYEEDDISGYLRIYKAKLLDDMRFETTGIRDRASSYYKSIMNLPLPENLKKRFISESYQIRRSLGETKAIKENLDTWDKLYTEKIRSYKELYKQGRKSEAETLRKETIYNFKINKAFAKADAFEKQAADIRRRVDEFYN